MKSCKALILNLFASAGFLCVVFSFPLGSHSGDWNDSNNGYVNHSAVINPSILQDFAKRQNPEALYKVMNSIPGVITVIIGMELPTFTHAEFSVAVVKALWNNNNNYNYIICHADHDYNFQGTPGLDWDHRRMDILVNPYTDLFLTYYDIVVGGAGTFVRHGDGGYENWAYIGYVTSRTDIGSDTIVVFNASPSSG